MVTRKTTRRTASRKASSEQGEAKTITPQEKRDAARKAAEEEFAGVLMHVCKVIGGRKVPEGHKVDCIQITTNRYNTPIARVVYKGEWIWMQPKHLEAVEVLPKAKEAAYAAELDEQQNATLLVPCNVLSERDRSVKLRNPGWFGGLWFAKSMVERLDGEFDGLEIFELPVWKIRKEVGAAAIETLESMQDKIGKAVK
jgi:hypothetical protein